MGSGDGRSVIDSLQIQEQNTLAVPVLFGRPLHKAAGVHSCSLRKTFRWFRVLSRSF